MKILNFGSLNIDYVYQVPHFVRPQETLAVQGMQRFVGGKGLNQSIALARAGATVWHIGLIGEDGQFLKETLAQNGVNVDFIRTLPDTPSGHAIIQVNPEGENNILIHGGTNQCFNLSFVEEVLGHADKDDVVLLQNEINLLPEIMTLAHKRGLRVVFNVAPATPAVQHYPLEYVDLLLFNAIEGEMLTGYHDSSAVFDALHMRAPKTTFVLTLGSQGACVFQNGETFFEPAIPVQAVDTTGAGDTFTGYFLNAWLKAQSIPVALDQACRAASICITRPGAAASIPYAHQLRAYETDRCLDEA